MVPTETNQPPSAQVSGALLAVRVLTREQVFAAVKGFVYDNPNKLLTHIGFSMDDTRVSPALVSSIMRHFPSAQINTNDQSRTITVQLNAGEGREFYRELMRFRSAHERKPVTVPQNDESPRRQKILSELQKPVFEAIDSNFKITRAPTELMVKFDPEKFPHRDDGRPWTETLYAMFAAPDFPKDQPKGVVKLFDADIGVFNEGYSRFLAEQGKGEGRG
jgi:hypothetical protein